MKKVLSLFLFSLLFFVFPILVSAQQIDINTATLSQLDKLTGIGPAKAQAIIDSRPYSSIDDLDRVKGIGPATIEKIKAQGLACVVGGTSDVPPTINEIAGPVELKTPPTPITYASGVYINEILPNPKGTDEIDEWIELYNSNNFEVDLSGWQIEDTAGTINTFIIPQNIKINTNGFLIFKRPQTKIMLNNDGDGINLLTPDGKIADSVFFTNAPLGQSYNRKNNNWVWTTTPTENSLNIITSPATKISKSLPKNEKNDNNSIATAGLTNANQDLNKNQEKLKDDNPWFLFFTALALTLISTIIVLFIKIKFKNIKNYERT